MNETKLKDETEFLLIELNSSNIPGDPSYAFTQDQELIKENQKLIKNEETEMFSKWASEAGVYIKFPEKKVEDTKDGKKDNTKSTPIAIATMMILTPITNEIIRLLFQYIEARIESRSHKSHYYKISILRDGKKQEIEIKSSGLTEEDKLKFIEISKELIR